MSSSALRFNIRFAQEAEDVAGHGGEPEARGYEPEPGRAGSRTRLGVAKGVIARRCEGCRQDAEVDEERDVLERLVEDVGEALGQGDGVEVGV